MIAGDLSMDLDATTQNIHIIEDEEPIPDRASFRRGTCAGIISASAIGVQSSLRCGP